MRTISSSEFRRTYGQLTEATVVTVNGRPIGYWHPRAHFDIDWAKLEAVKTLGSEPLAWERMTQADQNTVLRRLEEIFGPPSTPLGRAFERGEAQAQRDAILRKVNKETGG